MSTLFSGPYAVPTMIDLDAVPVVVIEHPGVTIPQLSDLSGADYPALGAASGAGRFTITGPPLAIYQGDPRSTFTARIGFPVAEPLDQVVEAGSGVEIVPWRLPAGRGLALTHSGSYDGLGASWETLAHAVDGPPSGEWLEVYVTDPASTPQDELRTDLYLMLAS